MLLIVRHPQSNRRYRVFVFQRVTQAENSYPAKCIEVHQLRLVWEGGGKMYCHYDTQHFETYTGMQKKWFSPAYETGFSLKASNVDRI